ncbi:ras-like protein family member 10B [Limulus polyphemus]|uniref:Ras-like protein family member 10B n=1 Tax=Limulus polyphemus TaxID=6850 RepID=A0ABM1TBD1_LIMPO|nr:ras-like protein family member 10B [Limulus polyphemus]
MNLVKLVVLGAPAVGKTSIIRQFVWNEFTDEYITTEIKQLFFPSVFINDHLYEMKISDVPTIPYFPANSFHEWTQLKLHGLRSAHAYILVFDLTSPDTFQYVKNLRDQIFETRNMQNVPVFVVGNKHDLSVSRDRREIASLVKKHWKCGYIECSARYNWHIVLLFKEIMKALDDVQFGQKPGSATVRLEGLRRNKCVIL